MALPYLRRRGDLSRYAEQEPSLHRPHPQELPEYLAHSVSNNAPSTNRGSYPSNLYQWSVARTVRRLGALLPLAIRPSSEVATAL